MFENIKKPQKTARRICVGGFQPTPRYPRYPQLGDGCGSIMEVSGAGTRANAIPAPNLKPACMRGGLAMTDLRCAVPAAQALLPFRSIGEIAAKVVLATAEKVAK